jgi:outer membrane receptor for ferrienterochelin and colicin
MSTALTNIVNNATKKQTEKWQTTVTIQTRFVTQMLLKIKD